MNRDLTQLANSKYDLLVIGGGIYGACVAWEATLRGLSVALLEKEDFGNATSANSLKTIHGGLRYLQHLDLKRMRESIRERRTLMRIAPHLVHPLPCLMPTYGHLMKGREAMALALKVNDLVSFDRNRLEDPQKHLPKGRVISRQECLQLLPDIATEGLTGGATWYDAQVYNSERLTLSFLLSATKAGTIVANYAKVTGFLREQDCVVGVEAEDMLTGNRFEVRAKSVVNTSGPWVNSVLGLLNGQRPSLGVRFAKAINLVTRSFCLTHAVAISSRNTSPANAASNKGGRLFFISPWRGHSVIGTAYSVWKEDPDHFTVTEDDIRCLLADFNQAYPAASLRREEISFIHGGLVPISGADPKTGTVQRSRCYQIHDHQREGLRGLISVVGVKYTTARDVAEKVVDQVFRMWRLKSPPSTSAFTRLHGGDIDQFDSFLQTEIRREPCGLDDKIIRHLIYNYGAVYPEILRSFERDFNREHKITDRLVVLRAEILHGVRHEMAQKLTDVVFRRTDLCTAGHCGDEILEFCSQVMGKELGWAQAKIQKELQEVQSVFTQKHLVVREEVKQ